MITDNCWDPVGHAISVRRKMERVGEGWRQGDTGSETQWESWGKLDEE